MSIRERDWTRGIELHVQHAVTIERMVIDERPIVILNPIRCLPGHTYIVDVNEHSNTATIREEDA
jgi:hypothetical protein